ncbi:RsmB/NOP family class I SAM-dependent RNA methyltransferase [Albidovulum sp.]
MTPAARIGAAIAILDRVLAGQPAEQALLRWARASRFAGSGDRAAVRDHVFDALRRLHSLTALSGAAEPSGRALMIGALREAGGDPDAVFSGAGHAPPPLSAGERARLAAAPALADLPPAQRLDCPDWLLPRFTAALGAAAEPVLAALRQRAPVYLRANLARLSRDELARRLRAEGIGTRPVDDVNTALEVTENANRIRASSCYAEGLCELQDLSPQAAVLRLPLAAGQRILDYCAGGGGKTLAMAALAAGQFFAHDIAPARMADLGARARRAGIAVTLIAPGRMAAAGLFDLVVADVPCSGSGTWRRTPDAKWRLTPARLEELGALQRDVLARAARHVAPGGTLAYMTCSLLAEENRGRIEAFRADNAGWSLAADHLFTPLSGGDGFYLALLTRPRIGP